MKKQVMSVVLAVMLAGGWYVAQAGPNAPGMGCRGPQPQAGEFGCRQQAGCRQGGGYLGPLTRIADELGLNESQRQQVETMIKDQQEQDEPLMSKIAAGKRQLWEASQGGAMDEAAVAELAAEQGKLMSEMMVSRIRLKNQIFAILTPQQQEQAAKLEDDRGPGCRPGCGQHPAPGL